MKKIHVGVVAIIIIILGAYLKYSQNTAVSPSTDQTTDVPAPKIESNDSINKQKEVSTQPVKKSNDPTVPVGLKDYSDALVSFQYPSDWRITDSVGYDKFIDPTDKGLDKDGVSARKPDPNIQYFVSSDAVYTNGDYNSLDKGRIFSYAIYETDDAPQSLEEEIKVVKAGAEEFGGRYERISIDGHDGILTNARNSGEGSSIEASFRINGKKYYFILECPDDSNLVEWEFIKTVLKTVKIK